MDTPANGIAFFVSHLLQGMCTLAHADRSGAAIISFAPLKVENSVNERPTARDVPAASGGRRRRVRGELARDASARSGRADLSVLIPAAGFGRRLGLGPKALLKLDGKPLISWLSQKLLRLSDDVIIAAPRGRVARFRRLCPGCRCILGGRTRQESVSLLFEASERRWILLADVARPFITVGLYRAVIAKARERGAAGAFLRPDVPVARVRGDRVVGAIKPEEAGLFQLPQVFSREILGDALAKTRRYRWIEQSTLELVLRAGHDVAVVSGDRLNLKLTTPEDWRFARLLSARLR